MSNVKEKADKLVEQYIKYTSGWTSINKPFEPPTAQYEGVRMKLGRAIQCAILSTEKTIKVLGEVLSDHNKHNIDPILVFDKIQEQNELLKELKNRLL